MAEISKEKFLDEEELKKLEKLKEELKKQKEESTSEDDNDEESDSTIELPVVEQKENESNDQAEDNEDLKEDNQHEHNQMSSEEEVESDESQKSSEDQINQEVRVQEDQEDQEDQEEGQKGSEIYENDQPKSIAVKPLVQDEYEKLQTSTKQDVDSTEFPGQEVKESSQQEVKGLIDETKKIVGDDGELTDESVDRLNANWEDEFFPEDSKNKKNKPEADDSWTQKPELADQLPVEQKIKTKKSWDEQHEYEEGANESSEFEIKRKKSEQTALPNVDQKNTIHEEKEILKTVKQVKSPQEISQVERIKPVTPAAAPFGGWTSLKTNNVSQSTVNANVNLEVHEGNDYGQYDKHKLFNFNLIGLVLLIVAIATIIFVGYMCIAEGDNGQICQEIGNIFEQLVEKIGGN